MSTIQIDTHIAVALYQGRLSGLSLAAKRMLDSSPLSMSPAVLLELELLHEIGRLRFGAQVIAQYLGRELDIAIASERMNDIVRHALPFAFTRDPFDRLIVAHADLLRAPLITQDASLHRHYSRALN